MSTLREHQNRHTKKYTARRRKGMSGPSTVQGMRLDKNGAQYLPNSVPAGYWKAQGNGLSSDLSEKARARAKKRAA